MKISSLFSNMVKNMRNIINLFKKRKSYIFYFLCIILINLSLINILIDNNKYKLIVLALIIIFNLTTFRLIKKSIKIQLEIDELDEKLEKLELKNKKYID